MRPDYGSMRRRCTRNFPAPAGVAPVDHPVGVARGLKRVRPGLTNQFIWPSPVARSVGTLHNAFASAI